MKKYVITENTYAIIPVYEGSKIISKEGKIIVNKSPKLIINRSCNYYGCSYNARLMGSKKLLEINYKVPILISEKQNLIMFPTSSVRSNNCIWLNLHTIKKYSKKDVNNVEITFINNLKININMSYFIFNKQILRSSRLDNIIYTRNFIK